ncbi:MAG: hypothetical protein GX606_07215 [Elusimicrobia bacterium]|nr:hypothetical protein [Elusimicrobiota bacterium]
MGVNPFSIPVLCSLCAILFAAIFVLWRGREVFTNRIFSLFCFNSCLWLFGYFMMYNTRDPDLALAWARLGFIGVAFLPVLGIHFIVSILGLKRHVLLNIAYVWTFVSGYLSSTPLIYNGIEKYFWGFYPTAGRLYFIFLSMFAGLSPTASSSFAGGSTGPRSRAGSSMPSSSGMSAMRF